MEDQISIYHRFTLQGSASYDRSLQLAQIARDQGLAISDEDAHQLICSRQESLARTGRIEFGQGILTDLIRTFGNSPFLQDDSCVECLDALQEIFDDFMQEAEDAGEALTSDILLDGMRLTFDEKVGGSLEMLANTPLVDVLDQYPDDINRELSAPDPEYEPLPRPWNEDEWLDRFEADGWDGEKWASDHE